MILSGFSISLIIMQNITIPTTAAISWTYAERSTCRTSSMTPIPVKNSASASSSKLVRLKIKYETEKNPHSTAARAPNITSGEYRFVPSFQNIASMLINRWNSVTISISFHALMAGLLLTFLKNQLERTSSSYSSPLRS